MASLENHGVLPLGSDILLAECISAKAAGLAGCRLVVAPTLPYSTAWEHEGFRVAVPASVFIEYLKWVVRGLARGSAGVVVAVFHGGAYHASYAAVRELRAEGLRVSLFDLWGSVSRRLAGLGASAGVIHADVVEASMLAACGVTRGARMVSMSEALAAIKERRPRLQPWMARDIEALYPSSPVAASRELGEGLVAAAAEELAEEACRLAREEAAGARR